MQHELDDLDQPRYDPIWDDDPLVDLDGTPLVNGVRVDTGAPFGSTPPSVQYGDFGGGDFGGGVF